MTKNQYHNGLFSGASSRTILLISSFFILLNLVGCDSDDPPPPDPGHVKVFLTSATFDGNLSGPAGADTACTTAANNAGQSGTWTAWISDNDEDAAVRINNGGGGPYQLLNGTVIANNFNDLTDGELAAPIWIDENGNTVNADFAVWTATGTDGFHIAVGGCLDWTTNVGTERGRIGFADQTDASWTDAGGGNTCDTTNRLYCFADVNSQ